MGLPWAHRSCQKTCSSMCSFLNGPTGPARSLPQHKLPAGSHLLQCRVFYGLQEDICSMFNFHGLQGYSCFIMVCPTDCRGISALRVECLLLLLLVLLHWPQCLCSLSSHILTSLSSCNCAGFIFTFLNVIPVVLLPPLKSLAFPQKPPL